VANPRRKREAQSSREEKQDSYSKVSPRITSLLVSPESSLKKHQRKFHRVNVARYFAIRFGCNIIWAIFNHMTKNKTAFSRKLDLRPLPPPN
jgi:hypothetical protein